MYQPVTLDLSRLLKGAVGYAVVCSIECARRNGFEPTGIASADDYECACALCGFEPEGLDNDAE